jgi:hypothetical protein
MHFQRKNLLANYESEGAAETIISRLESTTGIKAFTIWWATDLTKFQPDAASWRVPSLAVVRGTVLGAPDFALYRPLPTRFTIRWRTLRMEDQFDAILYLGPESAMTTAPLSPTICADRRYVETRLVRMALVGLPLAETDRLRRHCAAQTR